MDGAGYDRFKVIADLPVVRVETGETLKLGELDLYIAMIGCNTWGGHLEHRLVAEAFG